MPIKMGIVILAVALMIAGAAFGTPRCSCERTILMNVWSFFSHNVAYELPSQLISGEEAPDVPATAEMVVDTRGALCYFRILKTPIPGRSAALNDVVKKWRFRPAEMIQNGRRLPVCIRSKVYFYLKNRGGRLVWVVPGLTA